MPFGAIWCQLVPFGATCLDISNTLCNLARDAKLIFTNNSLNQSIKIKGNNHGTGSNTIFYSETIPNTQGVFYDWGTEVSKSISIYTS